MTKLCCFNQENLHFSVFEHHAERIKHEQVHWKDGMALKWFEPTGLSHLWHHAEKVPYKLQQKPKMTDKLKVVLKTIWEELPQEHNKVASNFIKRSTAYMAVAASDGHFKHLP